VALGLGQVCDNDNDNDNDNVNDIGMFFGFGPGLGIDERAGPSARGFCTPLEPLLRYLMLWSGSWGGGRRRASPGRSVSAAGSAAVNGSHGQAYASAARPVPGPGHVEARSGVGPGPGSSARRQMPPRDGSRDLPPPGLLHAATQNHYIPSGTLTFFFS